MGLRNLFGLVCMMTGCLVVGVLGEVRFLCPRPQVPNSQVTQGPCDPQGLATGTDIMTDVSPGPLTVRWEETVYRKGAPSRIALRSRSQNVTCILLDHIPHNDNQFVNKGSECNVNDYPIGRCRRSMTAVTVVIPDVQCDDCYLQLISVDTSGLAPGDAPCSIGDPNSSCPVYYSCANIKIWATEEGRQSSLQCQSYPGNLDGPWPYIPRITFSVNPDFFNLFFNKAFLELRGNRLNYDVQPKGLAANDIIPQTEGLYDAPTGLIARVFQSSSDTELVYQGSIELNPGSLRTRLLSNRLAIGLRSLSTGLIIFPLQVNTTEFADNSYSPLSAEYSSRGILRAIDPAFSQTAEFYTTAFLQEGPCAFPTKTTTAALTPSGTTTVVGLVRATIVEYNLYVTAVIAPPDGADVNTSLSLDFTSQVTRIFRFTNRLSIPQRMILTSMPKFVVEGLQDIVDFLTLSSGSPPENVEAVIRTGRQNSTLEGSLSPGVWGQVIDENGAITGLTTVNLLNTSSLYTKLLLVNFTTAPQLGGLFGPALPGRTGPRVFLPTSDVRLTDRSSGSWLVEATLTINSATHVRALWDGFHYIDIKRNVLTPPRSVSSQLSKLDLYACQNATHVACLVTELSVPVTPGGRSVPPKAFVAFYPLDSSRVELSMIVRGLESGDTVNRLELRNGSNGDITDITPSSFTTSPLEAGALEAEGLFVLAGSGPATLNSDNMRMVMFTSGFPNGEISGSLAGGITPQGQPTRVTTDTPAGGSTLSAVLPDQVTMDDFRIQCGDRDSGPMRIVLSKPGLTPAAVYAEDFFSTCSFVNSGSTWTLENARENNACGVQVLSGAGWVAYEVMVIVQLQPLIQTAADPRFALSCNFTGGQAEVRVVAGSLTVLNKPFQRKQETIRGAVDQTYTLSIVNNSDLVTPVSSAMLGDRIALVVSMLGTDSDEQSLRVRRCLATNTRQTEVVLLDNYCPVLQSVIEGNTGFVTSGTRAVLSGLQAFRVQDSPDGLIIFSCMVEPCSNAQTCTGNNCRSQTIRRKRQASEEDGPVLRIAIQLRVIDDQAQGPVIQAGSSPQTSDETNPSQFTLLMVIAGISSLLVISLLITTIALCRMRKAKGEKSVSSKSS